MTTRPRCTCPSDATMDHVPSCPLSSCVSDADQAAHEQREQATLEAVKRRWEAATAEHDRRVLEAVQRGWAGPFTWSPRPPRPPQGTPPGTP